MMMVRSRMIAGAMNTRTSAERIKALAAEQQAGSHARALADVKRERLRVWMDVPENYERMMATIRSGDKEAMFELVELVQGEGYAGWQSAVEAANAKLVTE